MQIKRQHTKIYFVFLKFTLINGSFPCCLKLKTKSAELHIIALSINCKLSNFTLTIIFLFLSVFYQE